MPLIAPHKAFGRVDNSWRSWKSAHVFRSGSWELAERVWVFSSGSWHLVWSRTANEAQNAVATLNGVAVDITWDAPSDIPESADEYVVRRSDNTIVASTAATGGSYLVTDASPLAGTHSYTVQSLIDGAVFESVVTNTVTLGVIPDSVIATVENEGVDSDVKVEWDTTPGAVSFDVFDIAGNKVGSTALRAILDSNPKAGVGSYSVRAVLSGGAQGDARLSNSLSLAQAPSSLTAAAPTNGDDVALSWSVAGCGHHDQIQVVRGGSSLTYLARGATSYTDTNAEEGLVNSYKVRAVISGNHGPYSNQATSAIPANVPTSVTAAATTTKGQVKLSWGHPTGSRTGYEVQANDGSWVNVSDTTSPSYHTFSGSSGSKSMRVRTLSAGGASAYVTASATPIWLYAPNVPRSVTVAATSTVGQLKLSWSAPTNDSTHDAPTSYQVQTSTNNSSWTNRGNQNSPYTYGFGSSGTGARYMRVRATNGAGSSSYVSKSGTPLWDVTPPALPTITSFKPESSYGRMVIRFTTSSSDNSQYEVNWRINGGGWNFGNIWNNVGNSQAVSQVLTTTPNDPGGYLLETRVRVRDQYQNTSGWTSTWNYTTEQSPIIVGPDSSGHWRSGVYGQNTSNPTRPYQGYYSNASYNYYGYFYYGTQIADRCNATGTVGGDKTVTNMRNYLIREGGGNNVADCVYLGTHTMTTNPGFVAGEAAPLSNLGCQGTLTYGQGAWLTLSTSARNALANGSQRGTGVAAPTGKPYMFLYPYTTQFSGWIEISHLG